LDCRNLFWPASVRQAQGNRPQKSTIIVCRVERAAALGPVSAALKKSKRATDWRVKSKQASMVLVTGRRKGLRKRWEARKISSRKQVPI
jgi:hypothetical protein